MRLVGGATPEVAMSCSDRNKMEAAVLNHIGIGEPDIGATAQYRDVLGFTALVEPQTVRADGCRMGVGVCDIFSLSFKHARIAQLTMAVGLGVELFQFEAPRPTRPRSLYEYRRLWFHFCLTTPDVKSAATRIESQGGMRLSKIWKLCANKEYRVAHIKIHGERYRAEQPSVFSAVVQPRSPGDRASCGQNLNR